MNENQARFNLLYAKVAAVNVLLCAILGYFVLHMFIGHRNVQALISHKRELATLGEILRSALSQKNELNKKIIAMRDKTLDIDLLEEYAISVLGYAHPKDIVYVTQASQE